MQKEINEIVDQLPNKSEFFREVAETFGIKFTSVKVNWMYGESIPDHLQLKVLKMAKDKLALVQ